MKPWGPLLAALLGGIVALVVQAPAGWLTRAVGQASGERLQLADAHGTLWRGSAQAVLSAGEDATAASRLPGRLHWQLGWAEGGASLRLWLDCCSPAGALPLRLQWAQGWRLSVPADAPAQHLPAAWLTGLGTPFNTLQLGGELRLLAAGLRLQQHTGHWQLQQGAVLELHGLSTRLATLPSLGSYRMRLQAPDRLTLETLTGALQLQGEGQLQPRARFSGSAQAAAGSELALNNLLNIIGRRQGARSLIAFPSP